MAEPVAVRLRDGAPVLIRPIEPDDRELLRAGMTHLSDRTRYLRFQAPVPDLSEQQLSYLTMVDHHDHEALVALDPETGDAVGVARFVRVDDDVAECAIVVADDWQGRGLGTELLDRLVQRAREEDVHRFTAVVLAENANVIRMLERLGDVVQRRSGPQIELDIALPEHVTADEPLRALLRATASGVLTPAMTMWRSVADFVYRRRAKAPAEPANAVVAHAHLNDDDAPAIRAVAGLAAARGAHVHLVASYWPLLGDRERAEERLSRIAGQLRGDGLEVSVHLCGGDAVDAVIDVAESCRAALIVLDPGASSSVMPWRPYSLPDRVCALAPCDVLIAR